MTNDYRGLPDSRLEGPRGISPPSSAPKRVVSLALLGGEDSNYNKDRRPDSTPYSLPPPLPPPLPSLSLVGEDHNVGTRGGDVGQGATSQTTCRSSITYQPQRLTLLPGVVRQEDVEAALAVPPKSLPPIKILPPIPSKGVHAYDVLARRARGRTHPRPAGTHKHPPSVERGVDRSRILDVDEPHNIGAKRAGMVEPPWAPKYPTPLERFVCSVFGEPPPDQHMVERRRAGGEGVKRRDDGVWETARRGGDGKLHNGVIPLGFSQGIPPETGEVSLCGLGLPRHECILPLPLFFHSKPQDSRTSSRHPRVLDPCPKTKTPARQTVQSRRFHIHPLLFSLPPAPPSLLAHPFPPAQSTAKVSKPTPPFTTRSRPPSSTTVPS